MIMATKEKLKAAVVIAGLFALVTVLLVEGLGVFRAGDVEMNTRAVSSSGFGFATAPSAKLIWRRSWMGLSSSRFGIPRRFERFKSILSFTR